MEWLRRWFSVMDILRMQFLEPLQKKLDAAKAEAQRICNTQTKTATVIPPPSPPARDAPVHSSGAAVDGPPPGIVVTEPPPPTPTATTPPPGKPDCTLQAKACMAAQESYAEAAHMQFNWNGAYNLPLPCVAEYSPYLRTALTTPQQQRLLSEWSRARAAYLRCSRGGSTPGTGIHRARIDGNGHVADVDEPPPSFGDGTYHSPHPRTIPHIWHRPNPYRRAPDGTHVATVHRGSSEGRGRHTARYSAARHDRTASARHGLAGHRFAGRGFAGHRFAGRSFAGHGFAGRSFSGHRFAGDSFGGRSFGGRGGGFGSHRSDIRLKHDIALLGRLDNGLGFYRFSYNGGNKVYVGVMAQEVQSIKPDAVVRGRDGYLRVYYERLGLHLQTWDQWQASGQRIPTAADSSRPYGIRFVDDRQ